MLLFLSLQIRIVLGLIFRSLIYEVLFTCKKICVRITLDYGN